MLGGSVLGLEFGFVHVEGVVFFVYGFGLVRRFEVFLIFESFEEFFG